MLEILSVLDSNLLELNVKGEVTLTELEEFYAQMEQTIQQHKSVRLLIRAEGRDGPEIPRLWMDMKNNASSFAGVTHLAVVTDPMWNTLLQTAMKPGPNLEVHFFPTGEEDAAREWIEAGK